MPESGGIMRKSAPRKRSRKHRVMDSKAMDGLLNQITQEILESCADCDLICLVGIDRRGVPLSQRLARKIEETRGIGPPLGTMDITLYRDDLDTISPQPVVKGSSIPFDVNGRDVILVDDVLFTGRTIRAALDQLTDFGRPRRIRLAVLVDRGHREYPIQGDFVGMTLDTTLEESVKVYVKELDGEDKVEVVQIG